MKCHFRLATLRCWRPHAGFTLVELMIAMVLGLLIIAGVGSVFVANKQTYTTSENLSVFQENVRYAFEMMTQDIRQADGMPCRRPQSPQYKSYPVETLILAEGSEVPPQCTTEYSEDANDWWKCWGNGIKGYTSDTPLPNKGVGTSTAARATGTDSLRVTGTSGPVYSVSSPSGTNPIRLTLPSGTETHGFGDNSKLIICDLWTASVLEKSGTSTNQVGYSGTLHGIFEVNSQISEYSQVIWYIGCNGLASCNASNGRSLYRIRNGVNQGSLIDGIRDLQIEYLSKGNSNYAETATWAEVIAVRITLDLSPPDAGPVGSDAPDSLTRRLSHVIALRNRIQTQ